MLLRAKAEQTQLLPGESLNVSAPQGAWKHLCVVTTADRSVLMVLRIPGEASKLHDSLFCL